MRLEGVVGRPPAPYGSDAESLFDHGHLEFAGEDPADRHSINQDFDAFVSIAVFANALHYFRVQPGRLFVCQVEYLLSGFISMMIPSNRVFENLFSLRCKIYT